jgi:hypothetical protein
MRTLLCILSLCLSQFLLAQQLPQAPVRIEKAYKMRHIGVYGGYNVNNINNGALERLVDLHNNKHLANGTYFGYKDFLRMSGFSAGFMAWTGKFYADAGFDIRQSKQTARFKDIPNQFQTLDLSMNSFHLGLGMNMTDPRGKVILSPGLSFGMGKMILKEINYRTESDIVIPAQQRTPIGTKDDSKNIASLNLYGTAFVNIMLGNINKGPKVILQPFVTLPFVQNDFSKAYYPNDVKTIDPALKSRLTYWGFKVAIAM